MNEKSKQNHRNHLLMVAAAREGKPGGLAYVRAFVEKMGQDEDTPIELLCQVCELARRYNMMEWDVYDARN